MTRIYNRREGRSRRRSLRKRMTKAEVLLWMQLKNRKLLGQRVLRQYGVGRYNVDFYIPKIKLAIEVDGVTHSTGEEVARDRRRQNDMENIGIHFLRLTNPEVYSEMSGVLEKIKASVNSLLAHTPRKG